VALKIYQHAAFHYCTNPKTGTLTSFTEHAQKITLQPVPHLFSTCIYPSYKFCSKHGPIIYFWPRGLADFTVGCLALTHIA